MSTSPKPQDSRWPHRWAMLLACATFPLLWWGGLVTATGSGMAFHDWLTSDGDFVLTYPWFSAVGDKFIEHGHRVLGMAAGAISIGLLVVCLRFEQRKWVKTFSAFLLLGVILQGVLGGARVLIDKDDVNLARLIALLHGCTGPLFFALCAVMAVVTSRSWMREADPDRSTNEGRIGRLAIVCTSVAYLQLVVGAVLRHSKLMITEQAETIFRVAVYFHLLLAAAVIAHVLMLATRCLCAKLHRVGAVSLLALISVQVLLGLGTWLSLYGMPHWARVAWRGRGWTELGYLNVELGALRSLIVTAHGAVGALIVATSLAIATLALRRSGASWKPALPTDSIMTGALA